MLVDVYVDMCINNSLQALDNYLCDIFDHVTGLSHTLYNVYYDICYFYYFCYIEYVECEGS